ncbi:MAG: hypothetical protein COU47_02250 [Candidatus Niyogibacteria bacterium CG10_big_fil_rev_8_21_14_0_10_46_36]|uniref:Uncharacterized protein n=1 Tax=Candidatus Niyogibacteria bacterium CG10_big_fil_rev_8_21_14_0_10_46_36 TaxID=1974726 RepID=A0A2H0TDC9_9BACT|nr:MAG: hypothetical protein COU47_02250 [Candidatus Niyogibacteria bacterium CG10_big_fil_rev_8_21_14_0_10_46_36]
MHILPATFSYVYWLYREGVGAFFRAWMNYHWFVYHFFSVPVLARTMFAPWRRMQEAGARGFDPEKIAERIIINSVLRITGFVIRFVFLLTAIASECALFVVGCILFLYFITSPVSVPATFITGVLLLL